jgi:hypothetical protein
MHVIVLRGLEALALGGLLLWIIQRHRARLNLSARLAPAAPSAEKEQRAQRVKIYANSSAISGAAGLLLMLAWMVVTSPVWLHTAFFVGGLGALVLGGAFAGLKGWTEAGPNP